MEHPFQRLIDSAVPLLGELRLGQPDMSAATVAAALLSRSGCIYTGVCVDVSCGIGFCAEHAAVAEMVKHRETEIEAIVAVSDGGILAPCGRCRELMFQISPNNLAAKVVLPNGRIALLGDLLPDCWLTK